MACGLLVHEAPADQDGHSRRNGKWLTVFDGVKRVLVELERFGTGHSGDPGDLQARRERGVSGQRGSHGAMTELNAAPAATEKELGAK